MRDPRNLPSGIVTFVFTDIEGSTRLFHQLGERYVEVLERHREILRSAWAEHDGHEVSTDGDAFFVAFESADDGVWACVDAQRALLDEDWPGEREVKVRMGVHAGLATPYDGDYVALAVHQAARVVAAGHGGQILVSEAAARRLAHPDAIGLRSLGHFRIRDFDQPELLYQVNQEGLHVDFPAVRALPADGHNLVRQPNATIGRDELIARLAAEVEPGVLMTLVGPGGVGKSRVASEVGVRIAADWVDGVWRVDLATINERDPLVAAIGEAVGAPARPGGDRWAEIVDHLRDRRAVLILDNCEHLLSACREVVRALLDSCPGVGVVATSREPVRAMGEVLRPVPPLPLPEPGTPADRALLMSPSVRLFAERGTAVRPDFTIDDQNVSLIISICRHLDGLPLSLELAAANLAVQSPAEILAGLEDRFRLLQSRSRTPGDRHGTMEGVLEWSFRMLSDSEQTAFRRLAVFGASFSLETATAAVAGDGIEPGDVPQLVWSLVDRSLVTAELAADATRYSLLETIQTYGRDRLDEVDEADAVASRVARHLLERVGPWNPADRGWIGDVSVEMGNLRSLVSMTASGSQELAQQLACTIGRYHDATASFQAGIDELARFVTLLDQPTSIRASMLTTLADLHLRTGDTDSAARLVDDADALRDEFAVPAWDDVGVDRARGEIARRSGDLSGAIEIARRTLERDLTDRGRSRMYNLWGTSSAALGDFATARDALTKELELNKRVGYEGYIASAEGNLAEVAMRLGDVPEAAGHQQACLELATAQGSVPMVAYSLLTAARVAGASEEWATAVRLHTAGERLLSEIGLVLYEDDREESDRLLGEARDNLGASSFDEAIEEGHALETPAAIDLADSVLASAKRET